MSWLLVLPLGLALWWLFDIRRALRLRLIPSRVQVQGPAEATVRPDETFRGATAPNRYAVVRWPQGGYEYHGSVGSLAKQVYEQASPLPGEAVEIWEQATCRGHKEG